MTPEDIRKLIKKAFFAVSCVLAAPLILMALAEKRFAKTDGLFVGLGQFLSLVPGTIGSYLRAAYYFWTLEQCSWEIRIGFGSFFSHRAGATVGANVSMGAFCVIGTAAIGDAVMIASHVSIPSGKRQHLDDQGRMKSEPHFERVTIGDNSWIGEGAIIMADVGKRCIVSAGSVVATDIQDCQLVAGNPGAVIKKLEGI